MFCTGDWGAVNPICEWHSDTIDLVCAVEGCGVRYFTKNLGYIGARSIFVRDFVVGCDHGFSKLKHECAEAAEWEQLLKEEN